MTYFVVKQGFITKELRLTGKNLVLVGAIQRSIFGIVRGNGISALELSTNEQLCFCCVYVYTHVERVTSVVKAAQEYRRISEFVLLMFLLLLMFSMLRRLSLVLML